VEHQIVELTAKIVSAHVSANEVAALDLPALIQQVHRALSTAGEAPVKENKAELAMDPKKSVFADHIICLDCGGRFKMLKRHLGAEHQTTPVDYRQKWGLPTSYPMVASHYAESRSKAAKEAGLGRKNEAPQPEKKKAGRPKKN
jgi:predicted transcriptional regulator